MPFIDPDEQAPTGFVDPDEKDKKKKTTFTEDAQLAFANMGNTADKAWSGLAGGLASIFSKDEADKIYKELEDRVKTRSQFVDMTGKEQGIGGKVAGAVSTLPMQVLGAPLSAFETGQSMIANGETLPTALAGTGIDTVGNAVGMAIPGGVGKSLLGKMVTGAGANAAQDTAVRQALSSIGEQKATQEQFAPNLEDAAVAGIVGAGTGAAMHRRPATAVEPIKPFIDPDVPVKPPIDTMAQHELFAPNEQGKMANKYDAAVGEWRVDENGIPVRVDKSLDALNVEQPLQRNLWGDELEPTRNPVGQSADLFAEGGRQEGTALTAAIDSMDPAARTAAIDSQLKGAIEPSGELLSAMMQATPERIQYVKEQATRIADGAPIERVLATEPDPVVRKAIVEEANPIKVLDQPIRGPRSQRGSTTFIKELADAIDWMKNKVSPPEIKIPANFKTNKSPAEVIASGTPGLGKALKNWVPEDKPVADVKAAVLAEGAENGSIILQQARSGVQMTAAQRKSALLTHGGDYILNGVKRAEKSIDENVRPVELLARKVSRSDMKLVSDILKEESHSGVELSRSELIDRGLSPKQLDLHAGVRDMNHATYEKMNATRIAQGMEPLTKRDAYLSSVFGGNFSIPIYNKAGRLIWFIQENSQRAALKAKEHLKKAGVNFDESKAVVSRKGQTKDTHGLFGDSFMMMRQLIDNTDPESIRAYEAYGQSKHFEDKVGVRGYKGDKPWNNPTSEAYSLIRAQIDTAKNAYKWSESQTAVAKVKELLSDPEIQRQQPRNAEYLRQYTKQHLGYGEMQSVRMLENDIANWLGKYGYSFGSGTAAVNIAKSAFILKSLSTNLGFLASQMVQPLNMVPEHALLSSQGYKHNVLKTTAMAALDWAGGMATSKIDHLTGGKGPELKMTKLGKDAWAYMRDNGIINRTVVDEAYGMGEHPKFEMTVHAVGSAIRGTENFIRGNVFLSYAHHLDQSGKFKSRSDLFQAAEKATERTMVSWRREERAMMFEKMGLVGSAASTLKSYLVNYWNNQGRYAQEFVRGNPKPFIYSVLVQQALYGAMNIQGMNEVDALIEGLKKALPDGTYAELKDFNLRKFMAESMPDWAAYGGVSKLTGINFAARGSVGLTESMSLSGLFPFMQEAGKMASLVKDGVTKPNETTAAQAAYTLAPAGPIQGHIGQSQPFQDNLGVRQDGTQGFQKPTKLAEHEHDWARTPEQIEKKKWGFTDLKEAREKDTIRVLDVADRALKERRDAIVDKAWDAKVRNRDDATNEEYQQHIENYIKLHGDPSILEKELIAKAIGMNISRTKMVAIKNNPNIPQSKKLEEIMKLIGRVP